MSGIFGIIRHDGGSVARADLDRMAAPLARMAPDGVRLWHDGPVGLGKPVMRTQNEELFDTQPLHEGAISLIADARIDNREELAAALGIDDATLARTADSALILAGWRAWGEGLVDRMIGDFIIAIHDHDSRTLKLIRDHMGQRNAFFHAGAGFFAFAPQRKALWAPPEVPRVFTDRQIATRLLLAFRTTPPDPLKPSDGIGWVPGGSIVTVAPDGSVSTRRYWTPHAAAEHVGRDTDYYIAAYRRVLEEAMQCRVRRSITPPALQFSGGFDSSAIAGLAGPVLKAQGRTMPAAVSVMPPGYKGIYADSRGWAERVDRHMPHLSVDYVTSEGLHFVDAAERAIPLNDAPPSPNNPYNTALFAAMAKAGARVCMDGHGGDYTINPDGHGVLFRMLKRGDYRRFVREWFARKRFRGHGHRHLLRDEILRELFPTGYRHWRAWRFNMVKPNLRAPIADDFYREALATGISDEQLPRPRTKREGMLRVLCRQQNAPTAASAMLAAIQGMIFTQPFHDKRVVELGLAIPEHLDMCEGRERWLARKALADIYPPEFQDRRPRSQLMGPDFADLVEHSLPRFLSEIDRMEKAGKLSRYVDFRRMRAMLLNRATSDRERHNPIGYHQAILAFQTARFVEWFNGDNQ